MGRGDLVLFEKIKDTCDRLMTEFEEIDEQRKKKLLSLGAYIFSKINKGEIPEVTFICTHNSRRSHMGQIWLAAAADYFQLPRIKTFSGGTEATAFDNRAIRAMQEIGFEIWEEEKKKNPVYRVCWKKEMEPYRAFSKKYGDAPNPRKNFAATMVCSQADEECPLVLGCEYRLSLPFEDPKVFDHTPEEGYRYGQSARQMGREILFALDPGQRR